MSNIFTPMIIKKACIDQMEKTNILASVVAAQAIQESTAFSSKHLETTNNLFNTLVVAKFSEWNGKCYFPSEDIVYNTVLEVPKDKKFRCLRVYDSYDESIADHYLYLSSDRKSINGPLRYKNLPGVTDVKKAINIIIRGGYQKDHLNTFNDPAYESELLSLIENMSLDKWDVEYDTIYAVVDNEGTEKYKTANINDAKTFANLVKNNKVKDTKSEEVLHDPWYTEPSNDMYRVKSTSDSDSIFASKILSDVKDKAAKHPGYKVFNEKNELVYDPHVKKESENIKASTGSMIKTVQQYKAGKIVKLESTPVFKSSTAIDPTFVLTGNYYIYDGVKYHNRIRISKINDVNRINGKDPSVILGYIDV